MHSRWKRSKQSPANETIDTTSEFRLRITNSANRFGKLNQFQIETKMLKSRLKKKSKTNKKIGSFKILNSFKILKVFEI